MNTKRCSSGLNQVCILISYMKFPKDKKKFVGNIIKIVIVTLAIWFLYKQIFYKENVSEVKDELLRVIKNLPTSGKIELFFAIVLMFLNWSIEGFKWKFLIKKVEKISFVKSLQATIAGVTTSIFSPNRIGEFIGRAFYLDKADRINAILIAIFGSYSKFIVTTAAGSLSLIFLPNLFVSPPTADFHLNYLIIILVILLNFLLFGLYFNPSLLISLAEKIKLQRKYMKYLNVFSYYSANELIIVLVYSLIRYFVFTVQFYFLLKVFGIALPFVQGIMLISLTFFVNSVVPTIAWTEIFVRGSVAISFIGALSSDDIGIITASFVLWFINIVVPALLGTIFVFRLKFFMKEE